MTTTTPSKAKIGIIGSGDVAKALGTGFLKHGFDVRLGTRDSSKLADWAKANPAAKVGTFADAARFADVAVLAVKASAAVDAVRLAGPANLSGKTVIDPTNAFADSPPVNGVLRLFTTPDDSQLERLQREFADIHFVKAFNQIGAHGMVNPAFSGGRPTMFIAGNDTEAKRIISGILEQFGWDAEDMGHAEAARAIEPLSVLWAIPGLLKNDWMHAFKLLR